MTPVKPRLRGSTDSVFIVCFHLGMHLELTSAGDKGDFNRCSASFGCQCNLGHITSPVRASLTNASSVTTVHLCAVLLEAESVCGAVGFHPCCTVEVPLVTNFGSKSFWDGRRVTSAV